MPRALMIAGGVLAALALIVAYRHQPELIAWATQQQRAFQNALAGGLRAMRAGDGGAWAGFLGLCFGYGFVHAVGPGHGKFLVGAYGFARPVSAAWLASISVAASLGQAVTAIALVFGGAALLGMTRARLTGIADGVLAQVSTLAIGAIGLWLVFRGARRLWRITQKAPTAAAQHDHNPGHHHPHEHHDHDHDHNHGHHHHHDTGICPDCGHRHAPSASEIAAAQSPREVAALIASVAIRPCSGAILLLILCWQLGMPLAGLAGAFTMASGTAALTVLVALTAAGARQGTIAALTGSPALRIAAGAMELAAGALILSLTLRGLGLI